VEYLDDYRYPEAEQLLWEVEATAEPLGKTTLPGVDANRPDNPDSLQAFVNAHRWTRLNRLREKDGIEDEPLLGVWNSAIQVHPFQLEPVIRALSMPRVSLLLADGVGLGKTIQSGLVLEELLLRRRIRRVLVLCPALLQRQWKLELRRKFNLDFEIIDSDSTFQLRRRMGIDTNPWKAFPRIITSMDYLRMPDVLQQFLQASGAGPDSETNSRILAHAPWDLLIADECHHFAPQGGGRASQRTRMLREIRFLFEHRVFASATPHNGKTVCFTGLLELLDPIRFQMSVEMDQKDKDSLAEVRIRRLKDDINRQSLRPLFAKQNDPIALPVRLSPLESALYEALRTYRKHGIAALASATAGERWLGHFIFSLLTKRLLSCPLAFARTWWRHLAHDEDKEADATTLFDMARVSAEKAEEQSKSDDERTVLEEDAARYSGTYFRNQHPQIEDHQRRVSKALEDLGYGRKIVEDEAKLAALAQKSDSKTDALMAWIKQHLFSKGKLRDDERLLVFTEYKETLFFLEQKLLQEGFDKNSLRLLFGGMHPNEFEAVKEEFEDKTAAVRLLLATDAASEGINMQEECRWVIHFDIPWSPSKIVQRNGRVSRHGQTRDVSIHYFRSDEDEDLDFLAYVAAKVSTIQDDLGSVERVFDAAIQRHFEGKKVEQKQIESAVEDQSKKSMEKADLGQSSGSDIADLTNRAKQLLESTDSRLGISPEALIDILRAAIAVEGQGSLDEIPEKAGCFRLKPPPRWEGLARQTLTVGSRTDRMELAFDAAVVEEEIDGRRFLKLKKHQVLMRLAHPIMRQAMATLCRQLHDPAKDGIFRWTLGALNRTGFEALLVFHSTVTAINELREPLHDEVISTVLRVEGDRLVPVEAEFEKAVLHGEILPVKAAKRRDDWVRTIRGHWFQHRTELEAFLKRQETQYRSTFERRAKRNLEREVEAAKESYRYRLRELQDRSREQELTKLAKALVREQAEAMQPTLFEDIHEEAKLRVHEIEEQMTVLRQDVDRTRQLLTKEQDHRLKTVLPKRFTLLAGSQGVRVLPLALTYLIPATPEDRHP